eukprot:6452166-Prymnesium_polylepis.1
MGVVAWFGSSEAQAAALGQRNVRRSGTVRYSRQVRYSRPRPRSRPPTRRTPRWTAKCRRLRIRVNYRRRNATLTSP